jgi:hypothetical protein
MHCEQVQPLIEALLDDELDPATASNVHAHCAACPSCQTQRRDEQMLRQALRTLPAPVPSEAFRQRAFVRAAQLARRRQRWTAWAGTAVAASLALGVALGVQWRPSESMAVPPTVAISVDSLQPVRLSFTAERSLQGATLTLVLPDRIELAGFPGQQSLSWQADLKQGANLLELPVVAHADAQGGELIARIRHNGAERQVSVRLQVVAAALVPSTLNL